MTKRSGYLYGVGLIILILGAVWFFITYYEGEKPEIIIKGSPSIMGQKKTLDIVCSDRKSGLRNISAVITQGEKRYVLYNINFPQKGIPKKTITLEIDTKELKLDDGPAVFSVSATDYSLRKNKNTEAIETTIDTTPPQIYQLSSSHYINPGGSCVSVYGLSEEVPKSGIMVDNDFFPSYPIVISGRSCRISYFAVPVNAGNKETNIKITAQDKAENTSVSPIYFHIKDKRFRKDNMYISANFLERKMPEFQQRYIQGTDLLETFLYANEKLREDNLNTVQSICRESQKEQLWKGTFSRMQNAANMATFGDMRTYYYNGKKISESTHMGIDLASTKNAPVEASNDGVVVFTDYLGIYGNTVIIDHGMGLFSLYAHLSTIDVKKGQEVGKGEIIGHTGTSGMAGGDHLHFSMIVGGKFVNPQEWWDPHWIQDNVETKLNGE